MLTENERKHLNADDRSRVLEHKPLIYDCAEDFPYPLGEELLVFPHKSYEPDHLWITFDRLRRNRKGKTVADYRLRDFRVSHLGLKTRVFRDDHYEYEPERIEKAVEDKQAAEAQIGITLRQMEQRKRMELVRYERRLLDARTKPSRSVRAILRHRNSLKRQLGDAA